VGSKYHTFMASRLCGEGLNHSRQRFSFPPAPDLSYKYVCGVCGHLYALLVTLLCLHHIFVFNSLFCQKDSSWLPNTQAGSSFYIAVLFPSHNVAPLRLQIFLLFITPFVTGLKVHKKSSLQTAMQYNFSVA
jgi:hypothetical protein